jgi:hypothetical protein
MICSETQLRRRNLEQEFSRILADNEQIEKGYKVMRDLFVFTKKRLILVDRQGLIRKKTDYHSVPHILLGRNNRTFRSGCGTRTLADRNASTYRGKFQERQQYLRCAESISYLYP